MYKFNSWYRNNTGYLYSSAAVATKWSRLCVRSKSPGWRRRPAWVATTGFHSISIQIEIFVLLLLIILCRYDVVLWWSQLIGFPFGTAVATAGESLTNIALLSHKSVRWIQFVICHAQWDSMVRLCGWCRYVCADDQDFQIFFYLEYCCQSSNAYAKSAGADP